MSGSTAAENRKRDSASLLLIGAFFIVFALLVLLGTFWEDWGAGMVVNIAAGLVLLCVGLGMTWAGWRMRPQPAQAGDGAGS